MGSLVEGERPLLGFLRVDAARRGTVKVQLVTQIRDAIVDLRLPAGSRLPSTRFVAQRLGIARNTVCEAFDQLLGEGYVVARQGAGTFVTQSPPARNANASLSRSKGSWQRVSRRGKLFAEGAARGSYGDKEPRAFQPGLPAIDLFPFATWARLTAKVLRNPPREVTGYGDPAGYRPLREAIASLLRTRRAVACTADDVIVTSSTMQSLDIVNRLFLDPDEEVWVEDPGSLAARASFTAAGIRLVAVPVDDEGLVVDRGVALAPRARMVHITPAAQWPTGVRLSEARRGRLLEWASEADAWIVEDDYNSVFRFDGERPSMVRAAIPGEDRVIVIGSFGMMTFPALRVGYILAPRDTVGAFAAAKAAIDRATPTIEQAVLAEFVLAGHYMRHLRKMAEIYRERRTAFERAIAAHVPELPFVLPAAGLYGLLRVGRIDDVRLVKEAAMRGVSMLPLSPMYLRRRAERGAILGFAVASPGEIRLGARRLRETLVALRPNERLG